MSVVVAYDSSSDNVNGNTRTNDYEQIIASLRIQLKDLHEKHKHVETRLIETTREMQSMQHLFTEQHEISMNEQKTYLLRICQVFEQLRGQQDRSSKEQSSNSSYQSLDDIKSRLNEQMTHFRARNVSLPVVKRQPTERSFVDRLAQLISKYESLFAALMPLPRSSTTVYESDHEPILTNLQSFLHTVYQRIKSDVQDKSKVDEQLLLLKSKQSIYAQWQSNIVQWINEPTNSLTNVKELVNRMTNEFEQSGESRVKSVSVSSHTPSVSNNGNSRVNDERAVRRR
jgi:hypothetical protein